MKRSTILENYKVHIKGKTMTWLEFEHSEEFREIQEEIKGV